MIIEPGKQDKKLADYLKDEPKRVLIVFWHGIGDVVQFLGIFEHLKVLYPKTHFDIGFAKGLQEEAFYPNAILLDNLDHIEEGYDITALIHFPVETDPKLTKSELCCREELGIEPLTAYRPIQRIHRSPFVAVHFNLTCLPDLVRPSEEVGGRIWEEIHEAGMVPIEVHFQHVFHNPANTKFDFVDCTVRGCRPNISSLLGILQRSVAFVGVVSGPFHCAMALMDHRRIAYLEKNIPLERFTHEKLQKFNLLDYQGGVKEWLANVQTIDNES